jgi:antitoxin component of RelBE/YafQ-DinJ toxin-antitoxin module
MIKEKDILVRVDEELKKKATEKAKKQGLSLSSYVRMLITKDLNNE